MEEFEVGDKIVHPSHGAGVIAAVEQKDMLDEYNRYYVIELAAQEMRLMVPISMSDEIGLRPVADDEQVQKILDILAGEADELPNDFKKRQSHLMDRLREGDTVSLAEVVRDMAARSRIKSYSPSEARLYDQARNMLAGELSLSLDTDVEAALDRIEDITLEAAEARAARANGEA